MSKAGVWLAWRLNRIFPALAFHKELEIAKSSVEANQKWAYEEARRVCRNFQPYWDLQDKWVLDLGHGLGGKLPFYLEARPRFLVGVDIDASSTRIAAQHVRSADLTAKQSRAAVLVCDGASLALGSDSLDAVVSINVLEHVARVEAVLSECHRVLKPGGLAYLHFPPYLSPWGPHLENWIHFPWPHLLFSDRTLLQVAAREDARMRLSEKFLEPACVEWETEDGKIPGVNRVTLRHFHRMVKSTGFRIVQLKYLPFGYEFLAKGFTAKRMLGRLLYGLTHVPFLQEIVVTKMVFVLQKAGRA